MKFSQWRAMRLVIDIPSKAQNDWVFLTFGKGLALYPFIIQTGCLVTTYIGELMKKASANFLVLFLAAVLVSFQSFAQNRGHNGSIAEQVNMNLRTYEKLRLADLLRLSRAEQQGLEVLSLSLMAESLLNAPAQLDLTQHGRPIASDKVRKQLKEVRMVLPPGTLLEGLELSAQAEIYIQSITAEVSRGRIPQPNPGPGPGRHQQPAPNSLLTLHVGQNTYGMMTLDLDKMTKQQLGISLKGAQIDRIVVQGQPTGYGRAASVQVQLNRRSVGQIKYLSTAQRQTPIQVQSLEEVRNLDLIVNGDAHISEIRIRVGQVRPELPEYPQTQRVYVGQEVSPRMHLEMSRLLGYESRLIRSITIEARGTRNIQAQLQIASQYGEIQAAVMVGPGQMRATIPLRRPMAAHELRLQSMSPVMIDALEIEFEQYPRY